jgi:hypothetical protein
MNGHAVFRADVSPQSVRRFTRWRHTWQLALSAAALAVTVGACGSSTAPKPKIAFAPATISLTAVTGGTATGSAAVRNAGGGTLNGLSASVGAYSNGASGWLTATLANADAPTAVNLSADASLLNPGAYTAVVNVSAATASPPTASMTVNLTVTH